MILGASNWIKKATNFLFLIFFVVAPKNRTVSSFGPKRDRMDVSKMYSNESKFCNVMSDE